MTYTAIRTTSLDYASNGRDPIARTEADASQSHYRYDTSGRLQYLTNAAEYVTSFTYADSSTPEPCQIQGPTLTTQMAFSDTDSPGLPTSIVDVEIQSTNSYTHTNGLVHTHTDPRGLTTTNLYDPLGRLACVFYPDGTTVSNQYILLHLAGVKDRLGNWTRYGYDGYGRLVGVTNALGRATTYGYCECGALETLSDALTNTTTFSYDDLGRLLLYHFARRHLGK